MHSQDGDDAVVQAAAASIRANASVLGLSTAGGTTRSRVDAPLGSCVTDRVSSQVLWWGDDDKMATMLEENKASSRGRSMNSATTTGTRPLEHYPDDGCFTVMCVCCWIITVVACMSVVSRRPCIRIGSDICFDPKLAVVNAAAMAKTVDVMLIQVCSL